MTSAMDEEQRSQKGWSSSEPRPAHSILSPLSARRRLSTALVSEMSAPVELQGRRILRRRREGNGGFNSLNPSTLHLSGLSTVRCRSPQHDTPSAIIGGEGVRARPCPLSSLSCHITSAAVSVSLPAVICFLSTIDCCAEYCHAFSTPSAAGGRL